MSITHQLSRFWRRYGALLICLVFLPLIAYLVFAITQINNPDYERKALLNEGVERYNEAQYLHALKDFDEVFEADTSDHIAQYDLASALYQAGEYEFSDTLFTALIARMTEGDKPDLLHGLANSMLRKGQIALGEDTLQGSYGSEATLDMIAESILHYKDVLRVQPKAEDSRYNLVYAKDLLSTYVQDPEESEQDQEQGAGENGEGEGEENQEGEDGESGEGEQQEGNQDPREEQSQTPGQQPGQQDAQLGDPSHAQQQAAHQPKSLSQEELQKRMMESHLDMLDQMEQETQQKMARKRMENGRTRSNSKDW